MMNPWFHDVDFGCQHRQNNDYSYGDLGFLDYLFYTFLIVTSPFWIPFWIASGVLHVVDLYGDKFIDLYKGFSSRVIQKVKELKYDYWDSAIKVNDAMKETEEQAQHLQKSLELVLSELADQSMEVELDFRAKKVLQAIAETSDFAHCLNGVAGVKINKNGMNAFIVKDYIRTILANYLKDDWNWDRRYECVSYVLLSDVIIRNEWQQSHRNNVAIDFLANEFSQFAKSKQISQMELWNTEKWQEYMNHLVTLLEFKVVNKKEAWALMEEMYPKTPYYISPTIKLLFSSKVFDSEHSRELDELIEKVIIEKPKIAYPAMQGPCTDRIILFKEIRVRTGGTAYSEIKDSFNRLVKEKGDDLQKTVQPKKDQYVGWTKSAHHLNFIQNLGDGPFKVLSRSMDNFKVKTYTIKTIQGPKTFSSNFLAPIFDESKFILPRN